MTASIQDGKEKQSFHLATWDIWDRSKHTLPFVCGLLTIFGRNILTVILDIIYVYLYTQALDETAIAFTAWSPDDGLSGGDSVDLEMPFCCHEVDFFRQPNFTIITG